MPATTPHERWPYPLLADPADPAGVQNLATAMDASLTRVHADRQAAMRRPAVSVSRIGGATTATVGTNAYLTFAVVDFDTATMANLTTNIDRITLPDGTIRDSTVDEGYVHFQREGITHIEEGMVEDRPRHASGCGR